MSERIITRRGRAEHWVDQGEFCRVWEGAATVKEVATKLGISKMSARHRAWRYRERGMEMKLMDPGLYRRLYKIP